MAEPGQFTQRRRHPRKQIRTNVSYHYANKLMNCVQVGSGYTVNLSMSGALVRIEIYIPPQAIVQLQIEMKSGGKISADSKVIHCHRVGYNQYEIGVSFVKVRKDPT